MLTQEQEALITRQIKSLVLVCTAMAASLPIYSGVGWFLASSIIVQGDMSLPGLILPVMGGVMLVIAPVLKKILTSRARPAQGFSAEVAQAYTIANMVAFAMRDGAGIVGLVTTLLTGSPLWTLILPAAALVAMILDWPSREKLVAHVTGQGASVVRG